MSSLPERPRFDRANQCLWRGEQRVDLSANAFRMLNFLIDKPNQLITKNSLLDALWPDAYVVDAVLSVTISQLREALGDDRRQPRFIETIYGRGYRWIGALAPESPAVESVRDSGANDLVGRETALAFLEASCERAMAGRRQMVFVTGEPGIGKTTVVDEFLRRLGAQPASSLGQTAAILGTGGNLVARGQCIDSYGMEEPYMPLLEALQQLAGHSTAVIEILRAQAPTWLSQLPGLIPAGEIEELRRSLASSTGARMLRELQQALESASRDQLVLLVLEDLHWSDPATVAALAGLALRRDPARLLVIGTYRPVDAIAELHPIVSLVHELTAKRQASELAIDGLDLDAVDTLLSRRFGQHRLPAEFASHLHRQSAGNPLFLLNALEDLEQRQWLRSRGGVWECTVDAKQLQEAVPDGTRAMVDARLRGLPPGLLSLLEAASIVGTSFACQTLAAIVARAVPEVEHDCMGLARASLYLKEIEAAHWPDGSRGSQLAFRHGLYQQVLYERVTPARRQGLHGAIADCLERGFGNQADEIASTLALHCELGGDIARAVTYHARAAEIAQSRYSFDHAAAQLRHALALLRRMPPSDARDTQEIDLQSGLSTCVYASDGPGAAELEDIANRIEVLSRDGATSPALFNALFGFIALCITRAELGRAEEGCRRVLQRAAQVEWGAFHADIGRGLLGFTQHRRGHFAEAVPHLEAGAALPLIGAVGMMEPSIAYASDLAFTLVLIGELRRGFALAKETFARAEAIGHPPTMVFTAGNLMRIAHMFADRQLVEVIAGKMGELGARLASRRFTAVSLLGNGWLRMTAGQADGYGLFDEAWKIFDEHSHFVYSPFSALTVAAALLGQGRIEEARRRLDQAADLLEQTEARWCEADYVRMRGELAVAEVAKLGPRSKERQRAIAAAVKIFESAIEMARRQGARWWELRARFSLARHLPPRERHEAAESLRALHMALEDNVEIAELRDIRSWLDQVG